MDSRELVIVRAIGDALKERFDRLSKQNGTQQISIPPPVVQATVRVDVEPIAAAVKEIGEQVSRIIDDIFSELTLEIRKLTAALEMKRTRTRRLRIQHGDGTESTIAEE